MDERPRFHVYKEGLIANRKDRICMIRIRSELSHRVHVAAGVLEGLKSAKSCFNH